MHEPTQLRSTSIIGVLDTAFRLYRAHFPALLRATISVIGTMMMILLIFQLSNRRSVTWMQLSPLRPEALLDALDQLRLGRDPFVVARGYGDDLLLLVCAQVLLTGTIIDIVAREYLQPFHVAPPTRPRGLRGELVLLPGVLAALPLSFFGAAIARRVVSIAPIVWKSDQLNRLEMLNSLWLNYGGELLVWLALLALCARLLLAPQAAVLERLRGHASLARSWSLTRGAYPRMVAGAVLIATVPALLVASLGLIPFLVLAVTKQAGLYAPLLGITTLLGQALLAPLAYVFQIAFFTLLYYDQRFRTEGYDLALQASQVTVGQVRTLTESGAARWKRDDMAGALLDFEQARVLQPDDRTILSNCIAAKLHLDDAAGALKDCEHALGLFREDSYFLYRRGVAKHQLGDLAGALADYDRALRLSPNETTALFNRAHLKHTIGEYDGAREDLLLLLRSKPGEALAMYNVACGYARQDQADAALDWLGRAIAEDQRYCVTAREDADFVALGSDPRFVALLNGSNGG
jgi:tetratricopeptide (TPR) repeat protein